MPSSLIRCVGVAVVLAATVSGDASGQAPRGLPLPRGEGMRWGGVDQPGYGQPLSGCPRRTMGLVDPDEKLSAGDQVTMDPRRGSAGSFPNTVKATGASSRMVIAADAAIEGLLNRDHYEVVNVQCSTARTFVSKKWLSL